MIYRKSDAELKLMAKSGKITADMHELVREAVKPGVSTAHLDRIAEEYYLKQGAQLAFKGYGGSQNGQPGFQGTLCTSINEEIVHGIPSEQRILKEGDVIKLDAGCVYEGWYSDSAVTWIVGDPANCDPEVVKLVENTRIGLWAGIMAARLGARIGDVSNAVGRVANHHKLGNVYEYVGHGVGKALHEDPAVPNMGAAGRGVKLAKGLVIAIEPMFNLGVSETETLEDEWTVITKDGKWSSHWEHTIAITEDGPWVLTARSDEPAFPHLEPEKIPVNLTL